MTDRFVRRLTNFVHALDAVDDVLLKDFGDYLYEYLINSLKVCYYEVCIEEHNVGGGQDDKIYYKQTGVVI